MILMNPNSWWCFLADLPNSQWTNLFLSKASQNTLPPTSWPQVFMEIITTPNFNHICLLPKLSRIPGYVFPEPSATSISNSWNLNDKFIWNFCLFRVLERMYLISFHFNFHMRQVSGTHKWLLNHPPQAVNSHRFYGCLHHQFAHVREEPNRVFVVQ